MGSFTYKRKSEIPFWYHHFFIFILSVQYKKIRKRKSTFFWAFFVSIFLFTLLMLMLNCVEKSRIFHQWGSSSNNSNKFIELLLYYATFNKKRKIEMEVHYVIVKVGKEENSHLENCVNIFCHFLKVFLSLSLYEIHIYTKNSQKNVAHSSNLLLLEKMSWRRKSPNTLKWGKIIKVATEYSNNNLHKWNWKCKKKRKEKRNEENLLHFLSLYSIVIDYETIWWHWIIKFFITMKEIVNNCTHTVSLPSSINLW